jgi:glycosyltransferase involved in cell wall biosynthesis
VDGIKIIEFNLAYSNRDGFLKRTWIFLQFAFRSISIALTHDYDVLFATSTPLTAGIPGIFARWLRGKKFVFEVRDLWPELPKAMGVITNPFLLFLMSLLEYISYKSAHKLIGLSPGICEGIVVKGISVNKIIQIPNGGDLELFSKNIEPWRPAEILENDLVLIYSGTHGIANGLNALLDAEKELKKRKVSGYKIIFIGDGREKFTLQERVKKECLDNIIFLNPVSKEKLVGLFRSCDVGLQILANVPAFYYGTSPNKFFDYLAVGLPVLTNYPGWVADLISRNNCGFACEPGNAISLADEIEKVISTKNSLKLMGENAKKLAHKEFNRSDLSLSWVNWVFFGLKK